MEESTTEVMDIAVHVTGTGTEVWCDSCADVVIVMRNGDTFSVADMVQKVDEHKASGECEGGRDG